MKEKDKIRLRLEEDMDKFFGSGGSVQSVDSSHNATAKLKVKHEKGRTRYVEKQDNTFKINSK